MILFPKVVIPPILPEPVTEIFPPKIPLPVKFRVPVGERVLEDEKNCRLPLVALVEETKVKVLPGLIPPLIIADPHKVKALAVEVMVPVAGLRLKLPVPEFEIVRLPKSVERETSPEASMLKSPESVRACEVNVSVPITVPVVKLPDPEFDIL